MKSLVLESSYQLPHKRVSCYESWSITSDEDWNKMVEAIASMLGNLSKTDYKFNLYLKGS